MRTQPLESMAPDNTPKQTVKILRPFWPHGRNVTGYQPGDVVPLDKEDAERAIREGFAVPYIATDHHVEKPAQGVTKAPRRANSRG